MKGFNSREWIVALKRYSVGIFLAAIACSTVCAQDRDERNRDCTILYFNALSDYDIDVVKMYSHAMIAAGFSVTVENYYDEKLRVKASPESNRRQKKNPKFWTGQEFLSDRYSADSQNWFEEMPDNISSGTEEDGISNLVGDVYWLTEAFSRDWGSGRRNRTFNLELRGKNPRRYRRDFERPNSNSGRVYLIYPNDKVSHRYSCERYEGARSSSSLVVDIPDNQLLRPEGGGVYKVPFDSLGYFATYNIELRGRSGDVGSGEALIKEEVKWGRQGKPELYLEHGNSRSRCYLVIDETYLSNLCLQIRDLNDSVVKPGDDGCEVCAAECLYKSVFTLRIQGLPIGDCSGNWSDPSLIRFQCTK